MGVGSAAAASAPGEPPARSRPTRYRPTADRRRPGRRKRSGPFRGRRGEGGGANQGEGITPPLPPPPPPRTDMLAADRAAPDANGRLTPTARVYPGGARWRRRMPGRHPTGRGGGGRRSGPLPPPPGLRAAGAPIPHPP